MNRQSSQRAPLAAHLLLPTALGASLLAGCATPASRPGDVAAKSRGQEDCIFANLVTDWAELDREHLILYALGSQLPYLVQLAFPSNELEFNMRVGVLDGDPDGRICGNGFDWILIPGGMPDRIQILSIRKLSKDEAKQMLAAAHPKKAANKGKIAPPVPAKAAE